MHTGESCMCADAMPMHSGCFDARARAPGDTLHSAAPAVTANVVRASALKCRTLPSSNNTDSDSSDDVPRPSGGRDASLPGPVMLSGLALKSATATGADRFTCTLPTPLPRRREQTDQDVLSDCVQEARVPTCTSACSSGGSGGGNVGVLCGVECMQSPTARSPWHSR